MSNGPWFYVVKCLDALEYERWLGTRKTPNLDGKATEQYDAGDGEEYVWDWALTEDTVTHRERWAAEKLMLARAAVHPNTKMWLAKVENRTAS